MHPARVKRSFKAHQIRQTLVRIERLVSWANPRERILVGQLDIEMPLGPRIHCDYVLDFGTMLVKISKRA